jgi:hypothetical protein
MSRFQASSSRRARSARTGLLLVILLLVSLPAAVAAKQTGAWGLATLEIGSTAIRPTAARSSRRTA